MPYGLWIKNRCHVLMEQINGNFASTFHLKIKPQVKDTFFMFSVFQPSIQRIHMYHCTLCACGTLYSILNTGNKMFLDINNDIIYSSTPQRRNDRAIVFYIEPRFYPLLRCPIISMLSFYFISCLCLSLPVCGWCDISLFLCQNWSLEFREKVYRGLCLITDGR